MRRQADRREEFGRWQFHSRLAKVSMPLCSKNDVQGRERTMSGRMNERKLSMPVKLNIDICLPRGSKFEKGHCIAWNLNNVYNVHETLAKAPTLMLKTADSTFIHVQRIMQMSTSA